MDRKQSVKKMAELYEPLHTTEPDDAPPPRTPARFLRQFPPPSPQPPFSPPSLSGQSSAPSYSTLTTLTKYDDDTYDSPTLAASSSAEEHSLVPKHDYDIYSYPTKSTINAASAASASATRHTHRQRNTSPHDPVPATEVFAKNAAPLSLPRLDKHLSSLPVLDFVEPSHTNSMPFAPMEALHKAKYTLEELEHNSRALPWWDRQGLLGMTIASIIGILGSSAYATYYSLQGVANTVQIFALILSTIVPITGEDISDDWKQLFLGKIPNIIALNLANSVLEALIYLIIFMSMASGLLYYFYYAAVDCDRYTRIEGLQQTVPEGRRWGITIATFILTVIYLPLSTMAAHILVWSNDIWVVPHNTTTTVPPDIPVLSQNTTLMRDPDDFCWTTTMEKNAINFAPALVVLSVLVIGGLTIWFPFALRKAILHSVPKVDPYTELGGRRNAVDLDNEYRHLLGRDRNPFSFLYAGYRRNWATYQSTYLFAKLSTLIIVAVMDNNNCLFRSIDSKKILYARQVLLLASTIGFFIAQCLFAPFSDPIANANEWFSRLNFVLTALIAALVAFEVPGSDIIGSYVLYAVYIITYGLTVYYIFIPLGFVARFVKRITRRIDFSVDIFSPRLDVSTTSIHARRRIWQEVISTILLTSPECSIPRSQPMAFAESRTSFFPPYLLDFRGSPAERHVENLKILQELGFLNYSKGVALIGGPDFAWYKELEAEIQAHYIGPDSFWDPHQFLKADNVVEGRGKYFGNSWWVPFPPTLVIRYDDGDFAMLNDAQDLQQFIQQNSSLGIRKRRELRIALRSLENQTVQWPYDHITNIGSQSIWSCRRKTTYSAKHKEHFETGILKIKRRGHLQWATTELGSGFDLELQYNKKISITGAELGVTDDFDLTSLLAHFLQLNYRLIAARLPHIEEALLEYRRHQLKESSWKTETMSYRFLTDVYYIPRTSFGARDDCEKHERDERVRQAIAGHEKTLDQTYDRFSAVTESETRCWWYIFWDDFWRRNRDTVPPLKLHEADFNPWFASSIAYTPLPRAALEAFLIQRGLMSQTGKRRDYLNCGMLNKIYLRLNETAFRGSSKVVLFHMGNHGSREYDMSSVDFEARIDAKLSSLGTGNATDHDTPAFISRPTFRWEGILDDPMSAEAKGKQRLFAKVGAWFGLTPLWRSSIPAQGLALDVRLVNGRYITLDDWHED